jgi:hypothetical protein
MQRMRFVGSSLPPITLCAPALSQDAPATAPVQPVSAEDRMSSSKPRHLRMSLNPASVREAKNMGYVDVAALVGDDASENRHKANLKLVDRNYAN